MNITDSSETEKKVRALVQVMGGTVLVAPAPAPSSGHLIIRFSLSPEPCWAWETTYTWEEALAIILVKTKAPQEAHQ